MKKNYKLSNKKFQIEMDTEAKLIAILEHLQLILPKEQMKNFSTKSLTK